MKTRVEFQQAKLLEPYFLADTLSKQPDYIEPGQEDFNTAMDKNEKEWRKIEKKFFKFIKKRAGLKSKNEIIDAYVVRGARRSMSSPLILKFKYDSDDFLAELIHELIHYLFSKNNTRAKKHHDNVTTSNHVHLFALMTEFYNNEINQPEKLEKIRRDHKSDDYKNAWKIVDKKGSKELIKEIKK